MKFNITYNAYLKITSKPVTSFFTQLFFGSYIEIKQCRRFSSDSAENKSLIHVQYFENVKNKNKNSYLEMVNIYKGKERLRRGHVEFIYSALKHMKEFGVEKDLEVYKSLVDVFPKGVMIARNLFQVEFMHYPKHQQCAIDLLEQMEINGVMPDWDMEDQLVNVFGTKGHPVRRYWRMMYWLPKFKNASPWPLPRPVPSDSLLLAKLAIARITSVDVNTKISLFKSSQVKDSVDDTWIVSGQSPDQQSLVEELPEGTPIYVEGGFRLWLRDKPITYFLLKTKENRIHNDKSDYHDVSNLRFGLWSGQKSLEKKKSVHEQEDGVILSCCATGTSSRDSLLSWVRCLEGTNPNLQKLAVVFTLHSLVEERAELPTSETSPAPT